MTMDEDLAQIDPTVQWRWQDLIEVSMDGKPYLRKVDVASYVCCCSIGPMDRYGDQEHAMVFEGNDSNCMLLMCCGSDMVAHSAYNYRRSRHGRPRSQRGKQPWL